MRKVAVAAALALGGGVAYRLVASGQLTLDLGYGRRLLPLGPVTRSIDAPRETVFDVIASPYLGRTPRAMAGEIEVLERGTDMVLAAHHTPIGRKLRATTVETVRFERPDRVTFRLVRGPVPHVAETFTLTETGGRTTFVYEGELGTDFGAAGQWWGTLVASKWVATVEASLASITEEAERRASLHRA